MAIAKRLSSKDRREQLLACALDVVREQGTEALTLAVVAERAGVTKPIAYEHFGTRAGLLIALYEQLDGEHLDAVREALSKAPRRLDDVVTVLSRAYMHCYVSMGPEWQAIAGALKGTEEMAAVHAQLMDRYVATYCEAFSTVVRLPKEDLRLACVGIVGAAEALAHEMLRARISEARAAKALGILMQAAFT